jgi:hypothetical protein
MRKIVMLLLAVLLGGCGVKAPLSEAEMFQEMRTSLSKIPAVYPMQDAISDKRLVNASVQPYFFNPSALKSFMDRIAKGMPAELVVVAYTDEGDPVLKIIRYDNKTFYAVLDTTRDKFGAKDIKEFKFTKWTVFKENGRNTYHLFNKDITYEAYMKSMYSSNSADWIDNLFVCHD